MKRTSLTVFLCTGKDCGKAWRRICHGWPGKWLKQQVEAAGLPYKLTVVETDCMDRCEQAACLCAVHGRRADLVTEVCSAHDSDRILASLRACVETAAAPFAGPAG